MYVIIIWLFLKIGDQSTRHTLMQRWKQGLSRAFSIGLLLPKSQVVDGNVVNNLEVLREKLQFDEVLLNILWYRQSDNTIIIQVLIISASEKNMWETGI